jgi:hypothetical protein
VAHLRSIGTIEDRVAYLKVAVLNDTRSFSGKQVLAILSTIMMEEYTLEVRTRLVAPLRSIVNYATALFMSDR